MIREIKFRAWDELNKRIIYPYTSSDILNRWENIMQFTGLKDKNGKEIYEGDILRLMETISEDDPAYPYYCDTMEVVFSDAWASFGITDGGAFFLIKDKGQIEVIGNIYEHPELL